MPKENKTVELNDEELEKVAGGGIYTIGNPKPAGYAFYGNSSKSLIFKVHSVTGYLNDDHGYLYAICYSTAAGDSSPVGSNSDREIDDYVKMYGQPNI